MAWNSGWDKIFTENRWGEYPALEVVRFIARNYFKNPEHNQIKILEVGCGTGANLWYIAREGFCAYGIDGSQIAINRAKNRFKENGLKGEFIVTDAINLPFDNNLFDCIIDYESIYANSLKDSKQIIGEVKRVLKPGGRFLSVTFSTGTYGDGRGVRLEGEENTYLKLYEGAFHNGYGIIRLTSEKEIYEIYGEHFDIKKIDYSIRSERNRSYEVKEWIIECEKL